MTDRARLRGARSRSRPPVARRGGLRAGVRAARRGGSGGGGRPDRPGVVGLVGHVERRTGRPRLVRRRAGRLLQPAQPLGRRAAGPAARRDPRDGAGRRLDDRPAGPARPAPARWTAAGVVAAATWAADQWSGRTTFGLGAALGVPRARGGQRPRDVPARLAGAVLAALAGATSPLASVFLLVAAAAWWWGARPGARAAAARRPAEPWWIAGGALLPVGAARLLGAVSGPEPSSAHQMVAALAATGLTWALLPPAHRVLRAGVALTAAAAAGDLADQRSGGLELGAAGPALRRPVLVAVARTELAGDPARGARRRRGCSRPC